MHNPEIIIVPVVFGFLYLMIRAFFHHRTRMKMIDRGVNPDDIQSYLTVDKIELSGFNWTKLGFILFAIGTSNLISDMMYFDDSTRFSSFMIAVGFIILVSPKLESIINKK